MLQKQDVPPTALDKDDRFGFFATRGLGGGGLSLAGLTDFVSEGFFDFGQRDSNT